MPFISVVSVASRFSVAYLVQTGGTSIRFASGSCNLPRRRGQSIGLGVRCVERSSSWPPYGRLVSLSRRCETWVLGLCIGEACGKPLSDVPSLRQGPVCETNRSYRQDRVRQLPLIGAALPALGSSVGLEHQHAARRERSHPSADSSQTDASRPFSRGTAQQTGHVPDRPQDGKTNEHAMVVLSLQGYGLDERIATSIGRPIAWRSPPGLRISPRRFDRPRRG